MTDASQYPEFDKTFREELRQEIAKSEQRPFVVSIMGQTGVGKTSLLKALFNKVILDSWIVGHVYPTTTKPESRTIQGENGQTLIINDLPGIGESSSADKSHLNTYENYFQRSDIILWTIQSDSRSTTFDTEALKDLLERLDEHARKDVMSKMVFVLTKVDTLLPAPWIMEYNQHSVRFSTEKQTRELIQQKQEFFQEQLILPFGKYIVSRTHNDANFVLDEAFQDEPDRDRFSSDENQVLFQGLLTRKRVEELSQKHKQYRSIFERLYENYYPVACSALFKYDMSRLMLVILSKLGSTNKLGSTAAQNFKQIVNPDRLGHMSLDEARGLCNLLVLSVSDKRRIFDLERGDFPDPTLDKVFYNGNKRKSRGIFSIFNRSKQRRNE